MRRRTDNVRRSLIDSARHQFLLNGYTATTVDAIAAEANMTKRTLYGYFKNKRELFLEVIRDAVGIPPNEEFFRVELKTQQDVADMLYAVAVSLNEVTTSSNYIRLLRIAIAEIPFQPDVSVLFEQSMAHRSLELLGQFLTTADEKGLVRVANPEVVARGFAGSFVVRMLLDGLLQAPGNTNLEPLSESEIHALIDTFMNMMRI